MKMELNITSYCRIKNKTVFVNGKELSVSKQDVASNFFADAYKYLEINYPKFHKMDNLSKLGIIATEAALKGNDFLNRNSPQDVAIIMANRASSLDTDRNYQNTISNKDHYLPSPALFVYTLPNIVIGEIAIKHKITGENAFFVTDAFDPQLLVNQAQITIGVTSAKAAICGWVDYDNGVPDALIYLVEMASDSIKNINFKPLNEGILNQFYK
jgi:3-oxoacyl-(acyl-carrier-protein) synthase